MPKVELSVSRCWHLISIVVSEPEPECSSPTIEQNGGVLYEGQTATLMCQVKYSGDPGWAPQFTWSGPDGVITDVLDQSVNQHVNMSIKVRGTPDVDGNIYTAMLHFVSYKVERRPNAATNIPQYSYQYSFPPLVVYCKCKILQ